ncbi:MAG: hypothetical protein N3G19_03800, partial [Candidatus Pacearchaeota archaeon]|nr:hypothetical protein [Candidatus Pacearchaeota archaeon]
KCADIRQACDVLNSHLDKILGQFYGQNIANAYVHGYELNISNARQVSYITGGEIKGNYMGSSVPIPTLTGQEVKVKLRFYYSKNR